MQSIKNWCLAVSCVSVLSGVIFTLIPKGTLKNTYRILVCIVMLFTFTSSVKSLRSAEIDFNKIISDYKDLSDSDDFDSSTLLVAQETYESYIESRLNEFFENISCECLCEYTNEKLRIESLVITGNFLKDDEDKIKELIKDLTDENTKVTIRRQENG